MSAPGNRIRHPPLKLRDNFRRSNSCPHLRPHLRARIAQSPERAIRRPTRTHHLRCRPSDRPEVVAPLAQWPPSAARISPGEQLARREGLSRPSAECAADAENYETGRRHSGLMELLGRICGGRQLLTAAADKGDSVGAHAGRPAPPRLNAVRSGQSGNSSGR
jgi:hypothetical protein